MYDVFVVLLLFFLHVYLSIVVSIFEVVCFVKREGVAGCWDLGER